jgi:dipeptidyl aminopeptidase/acylaminoacyl peptidase
MNATRFWPRWSHMRVWAGVCLGLAALNACGAPERLTVAPTILARPTVSATAKRAPTAAPRPAAPATAPPLPIFTETPDPTLTPETPYPPAPPVTPEPTSATPRETPTAPPTRVVTPVALPPAPALPLDQALAQFSSALLYTNRNGFLILTDGQRELWLTADETICDRAPSYQDQRGEWSPDGHYIAITCQHMGRSIVAILDTRTGELKPLEGGASDIDQNLAWPKAWSPDGSNLLIITQSSGGSEISLADAATGRVKRRSLIEMGRLWSAATWSPDGSRVAILLVRDRGGEAPPGTDPGLYLINADGSNRRYLTSIFIDGSVFRSIDWSRDGRFIVVDESIEDGLWANLISLDTGMGAAENITDTLQVPTVFRWAPDRRQYLVKEWLLDSAAGALPQATAEAAPAERKPHWSLYRANGTLVRRYSSDLDRSVVDVAWMPDSQQIMMLAERAEVEAEVIAASINGRETAIAHFPNTTIGHATTGKLAIAPGGALLAINVDVGRIIILDPQGQVRSEFDGQLIGWRPGADR